MLAFDRNHLRIIRRSATLLDEAEIPYVIGGGVASQLYGIRRTTHDIDFFLPADLAEKALGVFEKAGFPIERTDPEWIYKAFVEEEMIDLIFRPTGGLPIDQQMLEHARIVRSHRQRLRIAGPEDLLLLKISAGRFVEEPEVFWRHWKDALGLTRACALDWDYFLARVPYISLERALGFLMIARSEGLSVPPETVNTLLTRLNHDVKCRILTRPDFSSSPARGLDIDDFELGES
jgi:predicted nucleotidyltransferase